MKMEVYHIQLANEIAKSDKKFLRFKKDSPSEIDSSDHISEYRQTGQILNFLELVEGDCLFLFLF